MQRLIALLSILAFTIQAQVVTEQAAAQNTGALAGKEFFEPWKPTEEDSWDIKKAAHLLRRAGFGGSMTEIKIAYQNGLEWALRDLIHCERVENPMEKVLCKRLLGIGLRLLLTQGASHHLRLEKVRFC